MSTAAAAVAYARSGGIGTSNECGWGFHGLSMSKKEQHHKLTGKLKLKGHTGGNGNKIPCGRGGRLLATSKGEAYTAVL